MSKLLQRLNPFQRKPMTLDDDPYGYNRINFKVRFSLVGAVNAGKSTLAAAIAVAAQSMSAQLASFYCRVLPKSSNILIDAENLRKGRFPAKTDPYSPVAPEAGLVFGQRGSGFRAKDKIMQVPICDVGGEIYDFMGITRPNTIQYERIKNINRQVVQHIRESQGFIIVLPAPDAVMFSRDYRDKQTDSYLYQIMSQVMDHKLYSKTKIEGVAVWLTKWDQAQEDAKALGMDVFYQDDYRSMERFLVNGFPALSMLLKPLRDAGKVRYFRSKFSIAKREDGITPLTWDDGQPRIEILEDPNSYIRFKPVFEEQECVNFIKWAASFAQ